MLGSLAKLTASGSPKVSKDFDGKAYSNVNKTFFNSNHISAEYTSLHQDEWPL